MGDLARVAAADAVRLESNNALAFSAQGWVLHHNRIGVDYGKGFDYDGSLQAFCRAVQLGPRDLDTRESLANLLEFNRDGIRYAPDAQLIQAIENYRFVLEHRAGPRAQTAANLGIDVFYAGRYDEASAELLGLPETPLRLGIVLASIAATLWMPTRLQAAYKRHHILVISLDGIGATYLTRADEFHSRIPTLRKFMRDGTHAQGVTGVLPTLTYPSHTTMMTGEWPNVHGVYANQNFDPTGALHGQAITEAGTIKVQTLWQVAHDAGYTRASVGSPVTTDASGIDWLMPANAVFEGASEEGGSVQGDPDRHYDHPAGLRETLAPDVAAMEATNLEDRRLAWTVSILRRYKPDFMTTHLGDLDHAEHTTGPFSVESLNTLEALDGKVAMLITEEKKNYPDAVVVIVSDHGFLPVERTFHLNALLHAATAGDPGDWKAAAWVTGGTAAVMLKDPIDLTVKSQVERLLKETAAKPEYGIARIFTHDEAVKDGGFPDGLCYRDEARLQGRRRALRKVMTDTPHTGKHGYLPGHEELLASFLAIGPGVARGRNLGIIAMRQIAPTLASLLKLHALHGSVHALNIR